MKVAIPKISLIMLGLKKNPSEILQPRLYEVCSLEDATNYLIINGGAIVHFVYEVL